MVLIVPQGYGYGDNDNKELPRKVTFALKLV